MINTEITTTKGMEQAQKKVEQAKRLYAQEKKKANVNTPGLFEPPVRNLRATLPFRTEPSFR